MDQGENENVQRKESEDVQLKLAHQAVEVGKRGLLLAKIGLGLAIMAICVAIITAWLNYRLLKVERAIIAKTAHNVQVMTDDLGPFFDIEKPREGDLIADAVYNDMRGTFRGTIPREYCVCVLAKDADNYFFTSSKAEIIPSSKEWFQTGIRLSSEGAWRLCVCLANKEASQLLDAVDAGDKSAVFRQLPNGIEIMASVTVEKISTPVNGGAGD